MSPRWKYSAMLGLGITGLFAFDYVLETLAQAFPSLRRDPQIWGTYGDWASAIMPSAVILITVDLWLRERTERHESLVEQRLAEAERDRRRLQNITLEVRQGGGVWLHNGSKEELRLDANGITVIAPRHDALLGQAIEEVTFTALNRVWVLRRGGVVHPKTD